VNAPEMQGSKFDSVQSPGPRRLTENTQESAWWSKHLCQRMVFYLSIIMISTIFCAFVALTLSITGLKYPTNQNSASVVQNVGGIICSMLVFILSVNVIRLLIEFWAFATEAKEILHRSAELLKATNIEERDALWVLHDYQTSRNAAPLIPTFVWKIHGTHLREQWADFRPRR